MLFVWNGEPQTLSQSLAGKRARRLGDNERRADNVEEPTKARSGLKNVAAPEPRVTVPLECVVGPIRFVERWLSGHPRVA